MRTSADVDLKCLWEMAFSPTARIGLMMPTGLGTGAVGVPGSIASLKHAPRSALSQFLSP